ncbi:MAG TPA: exodeoxyribonuclease III [Thermoleophilaceae bacterium]
MRLATWNVNSLAARMPRVLDWLAQVQPDVLCLQETKLAEENFPHLEFSELGYVAATYGAGQWNGVAILTKVDAADVARGFDEEPGFPDPEARALAITWRDLRIWSVYVPNGRTPDDPHFEYKLAWLRAFRTALQADIEAGRRLVVCGDFNVAPTDKDVWDMAAFEGSTHVTPAERDAVKALLDLGLTDLQPRIVKGEPFTYWDYRAGNFHKGLGMRIDLILLANELASAVTDVYIDRDARKGTKPSDHAPLWVDLELPS